MTAVELVSKALADFCSVFNIESESGRCLGSGCLVHWTVSIIIHTKQPGCQKMAWPLKSLGEKVVKSNEVGSQEMTENDIIFINILWLFLGRHL